MEENFETPLTKNQRHALRVGDVVRVFDKTGLAAQGPVTAASRHYGSFTNQVTVAGCQFDLYHTAVVLYPAAPDTPEFRAPQVNLTMEGVFDIINDLLATPPSTSRPKAETVTLEEIVRATLGYDPAHNKDGSSHGGKSKTAWRNQRFSVAAANKALAELVDDGVIALVRESTDDAYVDFPGRMRTGWVLTEHYKQAEVLIAEERTGTRRAKLRREAEKNVLARMQAEVDAEHALLLAAAGL